MGTLSSDMFLNPLESPGKQRLRWTQELRGRFEEAVNQLGGADSKFLFWNFPERVAYILFHMTLMTKVLMRWRNRKEICQNFYIFHYMQFVTYFHVLNFSYHLSFICSMHFTLVFLCLFDGFLKFRSI